MLTREAALARALIRFPTPTPQGKECLDFIADLLNPLGFTCHFLPFENVFNLYARRGDASPHLCFLGHVDVVEEGTGWTHPPFEGVMSGNKLYGRGACDMKGAIAAFIAAVEETSACCGSVSLLLTSDEEGPSRFGTACVAKWLEERGEKIDLCLVGEPTSSKKIADTLKVGRRGSLCATVHVKGKMGHVAYSHLAHNPLPPLMRFLNVLLQKPLDEGHAYFPKSHLEVTHITTDTASFNVIPAYAAAYINIRFTPLHTEESLKAWIHTLQVEHGDPNFIWDIDVDVRALPFYTQDEKILAKIQKAITDETGYPAAISTDGGTSDGRFLKDLCPIVELGLFSPQAHQVDEHVALDDVTRLKRIYKGILEGM